MSVKYKWLMNCLEEMIPEYIKKGKNKLPTEIELSTTYKVSRQTVRLALSLLEEKGLIEKRQGSGSYITGRSTDSSANRIGIIISESQQYIYPNVLNDLMNTLSYYGYSYQVFETQNSILHERILLNHLLTQHFRGLIVEGCKSALPNPNLDLYYKLRSQGTPILFLHNYYSAFSDCTYVKDDNIQGSNLLVHHLIEQGHTAIGGLFQSDDLQGIERYQGFMEAMRNYNLTIPDERISWFRTSDLERLRNNPSTSFLKKIVQDSFKSCTAVICYNDEIAYYLYLSLQALEYHLPEDMAIASFDNSYLSSTHPMLLTSLSHKPHEIGLKAALLMIDLCKGFTVPSKELPWELIVRDSTKTPLS